MRGRRPSGPEYVDHLDGSAQAKERLKVVLETLAGTCRVQQACQRLGVSEPRFHQLRAQVLEAALARLEPRPAGRPPPPPAEQELLQERGARAAAEDLAVRTAQAREEIALILPRVVHEPPGPEKKTRPPTTPAQRRRRGTKRRT